MRSIPPVALSLACAAWVAFGPFPLSPAYRDALLLFSSVILFLLLFKASRRFVAAAPVHMGFWVLWSVLHFAVGGQQVLSSPPPAPEATPAAPYGAVAAPVPPPTMRAPAYTGPIEYPVQKTPQVRTQMDDTILAAPYTTLPSPTPTPTPTPAFGSGF
jgi:hypothetical protein